MNPCPCGHHGSFQRECRCNPPQIQKYRSKISGPLLDRIDIHVEVSSINEDELMSRPSGETSAVIRERVLNGRARQELRFEHSKSTCNGTMSPREIQEYCILDTESTHLLKLAISDLNLSARAYDRILRVARTIADLDTSEQIQAFHLSEAIQYRSLDRQRW